MSDRWRMVGFIASVAAASSALGRGAPAWWCAVLSGAVVAYLPWFVAWFRSM